MTRPPLIRQPREHEILANSEPLWASDEQVIEQGDHFKADYTHELAEPLTARWILVRVTAPALTPDGRKIP